mgnify:CR=1 FL=1
MWIAVLFLIAGNLLPGETFTALQANSVSGSITNTEGNPYKSGMLDETGAVKGDTAVVTGKAANNLGTTEAVQAETYDAMTAMYNKKSTNIVIRSKNAIQP